MTPDSSGLPTLRYRAGTESSPTLNPMTDPRPMVRGMPPGQRPRRKHKMTDVEFACGTCYLLRDPQAGEWVLGFGSGFRPEVRRFHLTRHYGIDPLSRRASRPSLNG